MEKKPLRATMPTVAGWIDDLREAFGADMINAAIRAGMDGQATFYAQENDQSAGTPQRPQENATAAPRCTNCRHESPMGTSRYCSARPELPPAYGADHPLRRQPGDRGATCTTYEAI